MRHCISPDCCDKTTAGPGGGSQPVDSEHGSRQESASRASSEPPISAVPVPATPSGLEGKEQNVAHEQNRPITVANGEPEGSSSGRTTGSWAAPNSSLNPKAAWPFPRTREELQRELSETRQRFEEAYAALHHAETAEASLKTATELLGEAADSLFASWPSEQVAGLRARIRQLLGKP